MSKETWKEFASEALLSYEYGVASLDFDEFGKVPYSAVSVVNEALIERIKQSDYPGIAIGICDFSTEAIAASYLKSVRDSLRGNNRKPYDPSAWKKGDLLSLGDFAFEFVSVGENMFGPCLIYSSPKEGTVQKAFSYIPAHVQKCAPGVTASKRKTMKNGTDLIQGLSEFGKLFYNELSYVDRPIAYATSKSAFANVPPTRLKNARVLVGKEALPLTSCVKVGYLDPAGTLKEYCDYSVAGHPAVFSVCRGDEGFGDLYYILEYLEEGGKLDCLIVEAPVSGSIEEMRSHLEDIIELGVKVIVFCNERTMEDSQTLDELGFAQFAWTKERLSELADLASGTQLRLTKREANYSRCVRTISAIADEDGYSDIARVIYGLNEKHFYPGGESAAAAETLSRILSFVIKQTEVIPRETAADLAAKVDKAASLLSDGSIDNILNVDEVEALQGAAKALKSALLSGDLTLKNVRAYELIEHSLSAENDVCLVVATDFSASGSLEYWRNEFYDLEDPARDSINVLTQGQFLKKGVMKGTDVIVSGWLRRSSMDDMFYSGLARSISVLLYRGNGFDLETKWYLGADEYWKRRGYRLNLRNSKMLAKLNIELDRPAEPTKANAAEQKAEEDNSLSAIIEKMDFAKAESERARDGEESTLARPVYFSDGRRRWLRVPDSNYGTGGDTLIVLDGVQSGFYAAYNRKSAAALRTGDLVLKCASDDEALDLVCKESFGSYEKTLAVARSWHEPIAAALKYMSEEAIKNRIKAAGSNKHDQTIMSWIRGNTSIAPRKKRDLRHISIALGGVFTDEDIERINKAVKIVKGIRISSGRNLNQEIADSFVSDVDLYGLDSAVEGFSERHPGLGEVEILCVENVGSSVQIPITKLGYYLE